MTFQDPKWRLESPGSVRIAAVNYFMELARRTAWQGLVRASTQGRVHDILEDFKWRFSNRSCSPSPTATWAEADLFTYMRSAAANAPVFVEAFAVACADVRKRGLTAPSVREINDALHTNHVGYQIEGDTIVRRHWTHPEDAGPRQSLANITPTLPTTGVVEVATVAAFERLPAGALSPQPVQVVTPTLPLLKAFLCHSSGDKPAVKRLHGFLKDNGHDPWLDTVNLLPGDEWQAEIKMAVKDSHVVIVCLSETSVTKAGFVQKEIKFALDVADEQPEGRVYIIPARFDDCKVPDRLSKWQWVDLFKEDGHAKLLSSLARRLKEVTS